MYYENPEVNDDRQYADFCLDNNGKSICEVESGELFLISKKNIEKAAKSLNNSWVHFKLNMNTNSTELITQNLKARYLILFFI